MSEDGRDTQPQFEVIGRLVDGFIIYYDGSPPRPWPQAPPPLLPQRLEGDDTATTKPADAVGSEEE